MSRKGKYNSNNKKERVLVRLCAYDIFTARLMCYTFVIHYEFIRQYEFKIKL